MLKENTGDADGGLEGIGPEVATAEGFDHADLFSSDISKLPNLNALLSGCLHSPGL